MGPGEGRNSLVLALAAATVSAAHSYLLVSEPEIAAASRKAESHAWARAALDELLRAADNALQQPVRIPDKVGQWPHWYSCKREVFTGVGPGRDRPTRVPMLIVRRRGGEYGL